MLSKSLSTSKKYAQLYQDALGDFCQALYPLLVAHADDYGRLEGDAFTIKHSVVPAAPRDEAAIADALQRLHDVHLIHRYEVEGAQYLQIVDFGRHQAGLKKRTQSTFPAPPTSPELAPHACVLDASEDDIEAWLARELKAGRLEVPGLTVHTVERQVRRGASYFDVLATTTEGSLLLFEVKRQRITDAALQQVLRYKAQLGPRNVVPILLGHGIASGANVLTGKALVAVYDDRRQISVLSTYRVKSRDLTLRRVPSEQKGTELKGSTSSGAAPLSRPPVDNADDNYAVIEKLAHLSIDVIGYSNLGDLTEDVKRRCAEERIAYASSVVRRAIDSAVVQRGRSAS